MEQVIKFQCSNRDVTEELPWQSTKAAMISGQLRINKYMTGRPEFTRTKNIMSYRNEDVDSNKWSKFERRYKEYKNKVRLWTWWNHFERLENGRPKSK